MENYTREYLRSLTDEELAAEIRALDSWDADLNEELCRRAGLETEWNESVSDEFEAKTLGVMTSEDVVFKAAEILNVEII